MGLMVATMKEEAGKGGKAKAAKAGQGRESRAKA